MRYQMFGSFRSGIRSCSKTCSNDRVPGRGLSELATSATSPDPLLEYPERGLPKSSPISLDAESVCKICSYQGRCCLSCLSCFAFHGDRAGDRVAAPIFANYDPVVTFAVPTAPAAPARPAVFADLTTFRIHHHIQPPQGTLQASNDSRNSSSSSSFGSSGKSPLRLVGLLLWC